MGAEFLLTIVRSTLAKLDGAKAVGEPGNISGDTAQSGQLLVGGLAGVVRVQDIGILEGGMLVAIRSQSALLMNRPIGRGGPFNNVGGRFRKKSC